MLNELSCNYSSTSVGRENVMLRGETERERERLRSRKRWELQYCLCKLKNPHTHKVIYRKDMYHYKDKYHM